MSNEMPKILIVEDKYEQALELEKNMREWGYTTLPSAATAAAAIKIALDNNPHLILMDIVLLGSENGIHAARVIRASGGTMPILFLTANDDFYLSEAASVGFFGFMSKPFDPLILRETVRSAVEHYEYQRMLLALERQRHAESLAAARSNSIGHLATGMMCTTAKLLSLCTSNLEQVKLPTVNLSLVTAKKAEELMRYACDIVQGGGKDLSNVSCNDLVTSVAQFANALLAPKISVTSIIPPQTCMVHVNPTQLKGLLLDLCFRAKKAIEETGGTGKLTLSVKRNDPKADGTTTIGVKMPEKGYVCIEVTDTGKDMEPEEVNRIFDPKIVSGKAGEEAGLGLWLLKQVITEYRGFVPKPESKVGQGTTFRIYLPAIGDNV